MTSDIGAFDDRNHRTSIRCMWSTVRKFVKEDLPVPQFYGKWPFRRYYGMQVREQRSIDRQEPASVLFSILNLITSFCMFVKLWRLREVKNELKDMWIHYAGLGCFTWFWSAGSLAFCVRCHRARQYSTRATTRSPSAWTTSARTHSCSSSSTRSCRASPGTIARSCTISLVLVDELADDQPGVGAFRRLLHLPRVPAE